MGFSISKVISDGFSTWKHNIKNIIGATILAYILVMIGLFIMIGSIASPGMILWGVLLFIILAIFSAWVEVSVYNPIVNSLKGRHESFVKYLNKNKKELHNPIVIVGNKNDIEVDIAIQYNESFSEKI